MNSMRCVLLYFRTSVAMLTPPPWLAVQHVYPARGGRPRLGRDHRRRFCRAPAPLTTGAGNDAAHRCRGGAHGVPGMDDPRPAPGRAVRAIAGRRGREGFSGLGVGEERFGGGDCGEGEGELPWLRRARSFSPGCTPSSGGPDPQSGAERSCLACPALVPLCAPSIARGRPPSLRAKGGQGPSASAGASLRAAGTDVDLADVLRACKVPPRPRRERDAGSSFLWTPPRLAVAPRDPATSATASVFMFLQGTKRSAGAKATSRGSLQVVAAGEGAAQRRICSSLAPPDPIPRLCCMSTARFAAA